MLVEALEEPILKLFKPKPMKKTYVVMYLLGAVMLFCFTQSFFPGNEENYRVMQILTKANLVSQQFPQEKIYLHLDRPSYWANDDIWLKAYLKNTPLPTCNLYVELLNEKGTVIYKKILWAQNGLAYGDIHLDDTISSGMYQVRAYTNWMRNFDEQWFYRKDLVVWNLRDKAKPAKQEELKSKRVDFRFLPEGGTFLAGVMNRVAFKAIDRNGKALDAEGIVLDENGRQVADFKSGFMGMGSFEMTPEPGMKYSAHVTVAGNLPMNIDLPEALGSGVAMGFDARDTSRIHINVNEQGTTANNKYLLIAQSEGKVCYHGEVSIMDGKGVIDIDKAKFPTGVVRFTLFGNEGLPCCERLVFVNHHDQVSLGIEAEETIYHPREKVTLDISALGKDETPLIANLSVSVYHTQTSHQGENYPENILTRFLLSSELKGRIEEPAYYFKDDSLTTILALDNLMLTHGYRYFEWKQVMDNEPPAIAYQPEASIELKGTVLTDLLHRPVAGAKVTMMSVKSLLSLQEQTTDAKGQFVFPDLFFNDTLHVALQLRKENGNAVSGLEIDERSFVSPNAAILPLTYAYSKEDPSATVTYLSDLSPELINRKWRLSDTILLGDVNVMARKKQEWDGVSRPYLEPDHVIEVSKLDDVYSKITETLEANSPIYRSFINRGGKFFIDGFIDRFNMIENIPASWVDRVEFVKMTHIPGGIIAPGIYVYTRRGAPNEKVEFAPGIKPVTLMGYAVVRNYYSPVYDGSEDKENKKSDFRSLLYWNPVVKTDSEGVTWVSFYNSDLVGEVQVVVEGVTTEGKLCRGVSKYYVIPKQLP